MPGAGTVGEGLVVRPGHPLGHHHPPGVHEQFSGLGRAEAVDAGEHQLKRWSAGLGIRNLCGSPATSAARSSFGNPKPMIVSSTENAANTIWPTRHFTRPRTTTS